ncbi:MAG TPA: porin PorA family protein [Candidatus Anoxymicrobiaceae bacterium]
MSSRWQRIKASKANLVLFVVGIFLIVLSGLWRFTIAPAIKVVATDFDLVRFDTGHYSVFVRPPGQPPVGPSPITYSVTIQGKEVNPVGRSTTSSAVIELQSAVIDTATRKHLSDDNSLFAVDRRTARQVKDQGSDKNRSGYYLVFPFNTPKADIPIWDPVTGKAQKGTFERQEKLFGINVYVFKVAYAGQPAVQPAGFPKQMSGAEFKSMLSDPMLPVADTDTINIEYKANQSIEYIVEPIGGTLVSMTNAVGSVYMSTAYGNPPTASVVTQSQTQVVSKLDFTESVTSQEAAATFASDEIQKIKLQEVYIPIGLLALGIACLLIGIFTAPKPD